MRAMCSVRLKATKTSLFRPISFQLGLVVLPAFSTTKSGSKSTSSSSVGRMNMFFTKCACQATSDTKRTFMREFSLAPQ